MNETIVEMARLDPFRIGISMSYHNRHSTDDYFYILFEVLLIIFNIFRSHVLLKCMWNISALMRDKKKKKSVVSGRLAS